MSSAWNWITANPWATTGIVIGSLLVVGLIVTVIVLAVLYAVPSSSSSATPPFIPLETLDYFVNPTVAPTKRLSADATLATIGPVSGDAPTQNYLGLASRWRFRLVNAANNIYSIQSNLTDPLGFPAGTSYLSWRTSGPSDITSAVIPLSHVAPEPAHWKLRSLSSTSVSLENVGNSLSNRLQWVSAASVPSLPFDHTTVVNVGDDNDPSVEWTMTPASAAPTAPSNAQFPSSASSYYIIATVSGPRWLTDTATDGSTIPISLTADGSTPHTQWTITTTPGTGWERIVTFTNTAVTSRIISSNLVGKPEASAATFANQFRLYLMPKVTLSGITGVGTLVGTYLIKAVPFIGMSQDWNCWTVLDSTPGELGWGPNQATSTATFNIYTA